MSIRIVRPEEDYNVIFEAAAILMESLPTHRRRIEGFLYNHNAKDNLRAIVSGERVVGGAIVGNNPETDSFYLHYLAIKPDYRGTGIGGVALDFLEEEGRSLGRRKLELVSDSERSDKFYTKRGYVYSKEDEEVKNIFSKDL